MRSAPNSDGGLVDQGLASRIEPRPEKQEEARDIKPATVQINAIVLTVKTGLPKVPIGRLVIIVDQFDHSAFESIGVRLPMVSGPCGQPVQA